MVKIWWSEEDQAFIAKDDDRPGCSACDATEAGALRELCDARVAWDQSHDKANR